MARRRDSRQPKEVIITPEDMEKATNMHELTELINQNLKPASLQTGTEVKIVTVDEDGTAKD